MATPIEAQSSAANLSPLNSAPPPKPEANADTFLRLLNDPVTMPASPKVPQASVTQTTVVGTASAQRAGTSIDTQSVGESTLVSAPLGNGFVFFMEERKAENQTTRTSPRGAQTTQDSTFRDTGVGINYRAPLDKNSAVTGQLRLGETQTNANEPSQNVRVQVGVNTNIPLGPDTQINLGMQARYTDNLQGPDTARIQGSVGLQQKIGATDAGPITANVTLTGRAQENNLPAGTGGGVGGLLGASVTIPLDKNLDLTIGYGKGSGVNTDPTDGPIPAIIPVNGASSSSDVLTFSVRSRL
jgi:hypothetical protein